MNVLILAAIAAGLILIGVVHRQLARLAPAWPGAVVPTLWLAVAAYLVASGRIHSLLDVAGLVLASVVLARIWHDGRSTRSAANSAPAPAPTSASTSTKV